MKVRVNQDRCQGHARCSAVAPDIFRLDSEGFVDIGAEVDIEPGREGEAQLAVDSCPESALISSE